MDRIVDVINSLSDLLTLKPATNAQITDAELQLRVSFADEYKQYLSAFGAIMADGVELSGIAKADHRNVVCLTKRERELNPNIPNNMYVIEDTHVDGIIIWQDTNGIIYKSEPNKSAIKVENSLSEYLLKREMRV